MEEDGYEVPIKARNIKAHLTFTVKKNVDEEIVEEVEVEVEVEVKEVSEGIEDTTEIDVNSDWELTVEPFKTTIEIRRSTPAVARAIANELNHLPIKGMTVWSPNQAGTVISILGTLGEEKDLKKIIQPLVINIMVEHCGDEK